MNIKVLMTLGWMLSLNIFVWAQSPITSVNILDVGDRVEEFTFDAENVNIGSSGPNVTWDFSSLFLESSQTYTVQPAEDGPKSNLFPGANLYIPRDNGDEHYYRKSNDSYSLVGSFLNSGDYIENYFQNLQEIIIYPIQYGEIYTEYYEGIINANGINYTRSGEIEVTADAHGTLITPFANYSDVVRVQVKYDFEDSYGGTISAEYQEVHYLWFSTSLPGPIMTHITGRSINTSSPDYHFGRCQRITANSVEPISATTNRPWPNPVRDQLNLQGGLEPFEYQIFNSSGHCVQKVLSTGNSHTIDVSKLNSGLYFIRSSNGNENHRFIKQ